MMYQVFTFVFKHLLLKLGKDKFFQSEQDLKRIIKEQNKLLAEKDKQIIQLQGMILNAGPRV